MGLAIRDIVPRKEITFQELSGKTLAVDAFNTLYQFLSTIRQPDGTPLQDSKGNITSHLSGIFYRNVALLTQNMKLIYVFDGVPPALKEKIRAIRSATRDDASKKHETAVDEGDISEMKKYASQLIRLDESMIAESKELLTAMGIAVVQAPGEGEAQAAYLASLDESIYAAVSQDYDSLLFGTPRLIQNLTLARKRKTVSGYIEIHPELIELRSVLHELHFSREQLIALGILVGTDYNPKGIPGIGPKKALKLVQQFSSVSDVFDSLESTISTLPPELQFNWKELFDLFMHPAVSPTKIEFPQMDLKKIEKILVDRHDFSRERLAKQFEELQTFAKKQNQKSLSRWF